MTWVMSIIGDGAVDGGSYRPPVPVAAAESLILASRPIG